MNKEQAPVETGEESYLLQGKFVPSEARTDELVKKKSVFIVAKNELDEERLSEQELLKGYRDQSKVERGFRFMKDPWFVASSHFLENEKGIMAMLMVMTLCLMV